MPSKKKAAKGAPAEKILKAAAKQGNAIAKQEQAVAPKKAKAKPAKAPEAKKTKAESSRSGSPKSGKPKSGNKKLAKLSKAEGAQETATQEAATLISSKVVYQGPLFRVVHDKLLEPGGKPSERDVIRHNGSVVILAIDSSKSRKNPWIVVERQYRYAANQYLWELPAGKLDAGEDALAGAQRELAEETGYSAKKWKPLVEYFASPGFLGESMKVFIAEGLVAGNAAPEEDEDIEFRLVKLSEVLKMIEKGAIKDGKTLTSVLLYARVLREKRRK
jgi:ADP-ribose pyrophosphatase